MAVRILDEIDIPVPDHLIVDSANYRPSWIMRAVSVSDEEMEKHDRESEELSVVEPECQKQEMTLLQKIKDALGKVEEIHFGAVGLSLWAGLLIAPHIFQYLFALWYGGMILVVLPCVALGILRESAKEDAERRRRG